MIDRYSNQSIETIWSRVATIDRWMEVELAAVSVRDSVSAYRIRQYLDWGARDKALFLEEVSAAEAHMKHDVAAFVHVCCDQLEKAGHADLSAIFHYKLTSSDVVDTALAMAVNDSCKVVWCLLSETRSTLGNLPGGEVGPGVARTHGRAALPMEEWTQRFVYYREQLDAAWNVFTTVRSHTNIAKMRGPTGHELDGNFERDVFHALEIRGSRRTHQIQCASRVDHFQILSGLFAVIMVVEKAAIDLRILAVEEVGEVNEGYGPGRVGSSSMPHKSNPVNIEKISGLTRLLRGFLLTASENAALWLERDISHSSVERIVFPSFFHLVCHILTTFNSVLANLQVNAGAIARNLQSAAPAMESYRKLHENLKHGRNAGRQSVR